VGDDGGGRRAGARNDADDAAEAGAPRDRAPDVPDVPEPDRESLARRPLRPEVAVGGEKIDHLADREEADPDDGEVDAAPQARNAEGEAREIGRASCRERR